MVERVVDGARAKDQGRGAAAVGKGPSSLMRDKDEEAMTIGARKKAFGNRPLPRSAHLRINTWDITLFPFALTVGMAGFRLRRLRLAEGTMRSSKPIQI